MNLIRCFLNIFHLSKIGFIKLNYKFESAFGELEFQGLSPDQRIGIFCNHCPQLRENKLPPSRLRRATSLFEQCHQLNEYVKSNPAPGANSPTCQLRWRCPPSLSERAYVLRHTNLPSLKGKVPVGRMSCAHRASFHIGVSARATRLKLMTLPL